MNKKESIFLISVSLIAIFSFSDIFLTGNNTAEYSLSANVNDSIWVEDIPQIILLVNSSSFVLDSDLSSQGNGHCQSINTANFLVVEENTSKVDCTIIGNALSVEPALNFEGNSSCEIRCNSTDFSDNNVTIFVIETTDPEPETTTVIRKSGSRGISQAQLGYILGQENIINIAINPESIKAKLFPGQGITEIITIENKLNEIYTLYPTKTGIVSYVNVQNKVVLQPNSISKIPVVITIPEDEYRKIITGTIKLDEFTDLSIAVDILSPLFTGFDSEKVDLLVTLGSNYVSPTLIFTGEIDKKNILPGTLIKPKIKLTNFYDEGYDEITLTYYLYDMNNNELFSFTDNYVTNNDLTLNILLPEDIPTGKYALTFVAEYDALTSQNTQTLEIVSKSGIITDELIILTLIIGILIYSIYAINRSRRYSY